MRVVKTGTYYDVNSSYNASSGKLKKGIAVGVGLMVISVSGKILAEGISGTLVSSASDFLSTGSTDSFFTSLSVSLQNNDIVVNLKEIGMTIVQFVIAIIVLLGSLFKSVQGYLAVINCKSVL